MSQSVARCIMLPVTEHQFIAVVERNFGPKNDFFSEDTSLISELIGAHHRQDFEFGADLILALFGKK